MIEELTKHMVVFPGQANHIHCFAHIINLVARSLLKQFNIPENKVGPAVSTAQQELQELAEKLEMDGPGGNGSQDTDNVDGFANETERPKECQRVSCKTW